MSFLFRQKQEPVSSISSFYKFKTRFSMLGTVGSGKTTINGCTVLTAQTRSNQDPTFKCRVLEGPGGILEAVSNLRRGRFPTKTQSHPMFAVESGLLMKWQGRFREKRVHIPVCDLAGEDIQLMIKQFSSVAPNPTTYGQMSRIITYVKDSDGFILCVPASKALLFADDQQIEQEPQDVAFDPDVNLARILEQIISHKEQSGGREIKGIAVVITKWDLMMPYAQQMNMDIYTDAGRNTFMKVCFPSTSMVLDFYGLDRVAFFPSYVQAQRDEEGQIVKWPDGSNKIEVMQHLRVPKYAESSYVGLIEWLKSFAS